jgi:hypothetical protein
VQALPLRHNAYKVPLVKALVKRAIRADEWTCNLGQESVGKRSSSGSPGTCSGHRWWAGVVPPRPAVKTFSPHHKREAGEVTAWKRRPARQHRAPLVRGPHVPLGDGVLDARALVFTALPPVVGIKFAWPTGTGWRAHCHRLDLPHHPRHLLHGLLSIKSARGHPRSQAEMMREFGTTLGPAGQYPWAIALSHGGASPASARSSRGSDETRIRQPPMERNLYWMSDAAYGFTYVTTV